MNCRIIVAKLRLLETVYKHSEGKGETALLVKDAADAIEELICEVADEHNARLDAEERQRWIPVTERLPEEKINPYTHDFELIICATNFGDVRAYKYGTPIGWDEPHFWNGAGLMDWYVTHWMPLPEPPKEET